ncbi:ArsR/SmtB family transcription factor [Calditerricola satsumensis]|uniref:HTH arsR-type domain-containing protein n=1 Tax=Calditerricola satsumensis TaxID=373054 RepID=A0A8J3BAF1_9BACI|nr:DUF5937 family protein [Calditerricola satsumensis]GGK07509.1 hypothetical protein GCM10007043_21910 [Calditerricola satsumensis]
MIDVHLGDQPEEKIRFTYSPLGELVHALGALVNPKRHPLHLRWILAQKAALPRDLWREIRVLSFAYKTWQLGLFSPTPEDDLLTFEDELTRVATLPLPRFVEEVGRAFTPMEAERDFTAEEILGDPMAQQTLLKEARRLSPLYEEPAQQLLADPEALRARFLRLLARFWEESFAAEWERLEPLFLADIAEKGERLRQIGLYAFFRETFPDCVVHKHENMLRFRKRYEAVVDLDQHDHLLLVPSWFTWSFSRVECDPPWTPAIIYPVVRHDLALRAPLHRWERVYAALAHEVRLRILHLCWQAPRSTQELARLLHLTEGAISRHVHQLLDAGLLVGKRQSYYVMYRTAGERLRAVAHALLPLLHQPLLKDPPAPTHATEGGCQP